MPESETVLVFRILGILFKARDRDQALVLDEIAGEAHLGRQQTERFMRVLEQAGAIRAEGAPAIASRYRLTTYGRERLGGVTV
jgi:DNA-binding IclR family transcriptional regulator